MRPSTNASSARVALLVLALVAAGILALLHFGGDGAIESPVERASTTTVDAVAAALAGPIELDAAAARMDTPGAVTESARAEAQTVSSSAGPHLHVKLFVRGRGIPSSDNVLDAPLPNVNVDLVFAAPGEEFEAQPVARVQGDAEGLVELDLDWSLVEAARARSVWSRLVARVHESGWQWNTAERDLPSRPGAVEFWLVASRGGTLLVHTTDESGRRVGAEVSVSRLSSNRPIRRFEKMRAANDYGSFAFHFDGEETCEFFAEAEHIGNAVALDTFVHFTDPPQVLELTLKGPGILRGHVRDDRGGPAVGLALEVELAARAAWKAEPGMRVGATSSDLLGQLEFTQMTGTSAFRDEVGGGLTRARAVTDRDGAFAIYGLRRDLYRIRVPGPQSWDSAVELTPAPVLADGSALTLVRDRPHLVVRVVDAAGKPWKHASWTQAPRPELPWDVDTPALSWPTEPRVRVTPTPRVGDTWPTPIRSSAVEENEWVFDVEAGRAHEIVLDGGDLTPRVQRVEVPENAGRIDVDMRAIVGGVGSVDLQVLDLAGTPVEEGLTIRVEDPSTNIVLVQVASTENFSQTWPSTFDVPAGRWRLVVEGREMYTHVNTRRGERTFGRVETAIVVRAKQREEVTVRLGLGGRLRLTLRGEPLADSKPTEPLGDRISSLPLMTPMLPGAAVTLLESGRDPVSLTFDESGVKDLAHITHAQAWARAGPPRLGQTRMSFVMPAGEYTLDVRMPDGRKATKPVVLVEGDVTDVTIEF